MKRVGFTSVRNGMVLKEKIDVVKRVAIEFVQFTDFFEAYVEQFCAVEGDVDAILV